MDVMESLEKVRRRRRAKDVPVHIVVTTRLSFVSSRELRLLKINRKWDFAPSFEYKVY